ncbi:M20/M25/M40 family metallo-hydrolase [Metabacillus iocasae]|uniref:Arginine utilization protein RocB n=1 Tax=Priestia iocasae TaxID=2291674 RepID=A0ABS2QU04_9BACI|nr:M20/M25/M40 family metallo-hydrolase [Metabacillus iocasae]MBM7702241.1 arginine utilization protein RocB [Metabacillus iocasae]
MHTNQTLYESKEALTQLLCDLVEVPSVTGTISEVEMAQVIHDKVARLSYFHQHPTHVQLHSTGDGRSVVTGLVKKEKSQKTVVLLSHFDVVDVYDYGVFQDKAFQPRELTDYFYKHTHFLPLHVQNELSEAEWLFGRGTMDMKAGLALHISMLEKASNGEFDGNVLLLSVPDEEVNSVGMRTAVSILLQLQKEHDLQYELMFNGEPVFSRYPGDPTTYMYSGSIGKLMPSFLCYGKETHVGEPFAGLNANLLASELTRHLELNIGFCEVVDGEVSPPPTVLFQKDLKEEYSVQIPNRAVVLFNLFLMEKSILDVMAPLMNVASEAARYVKETVQNRAAQYALLESSTPRAVDIHVFTYEELYTYAVTQHGEEVVKELQANVLEQHAGEDDRIRSIKLVDELSILCREVAPMIVLFFTPPFYPAICSKENEKLRAIVHSVKAKAKTYDVDLIEQAYFGGISDLSYAGLQHPLDTFTPFVTNMPLWEKGYDIPLKELADIHVPVFNLGPIGRDAHQWTERLNVTYSFGVLPTFIEHVIHEALK